MRRPMLYMLAATVLFFGALFGWKAFVGAQMQASMAAMRPPPVTVSATTATTESWTPTIAAVGSLRASRGVDVTAQVAGQIISLDFESGDVVAAGELLARQYAADEEAQLAGLAADRRLAEINLRRAHELAKQKLIAAFDVDTRETDLERARAAEDELRLKIRQKSIQAPFAGRLGIRRVDLGQYINPGDPIVRLEALDQILVDFPVPQQQLGRLRLGQPVSVAVDAWPEQRFRGKILAIEPQVERDTRNIRVRAQMDNPDGKLVPGMFARIDIELPALTQVVTLPHAAVTHSPYGDSVFVVTEQPGEDGQRGLVVANTLVVTGDTRGDQIAITSGLEAGALVVTAGQQKLRNGAQVVIDNSVPVSNDPQPRPENN
ncbi:MAG: efflux RND transporter periplasmic adaptor subunit [Gammaproteobacteria bacterium]|nr:efflux RND transporter periplasmic adaptor subunit [Gammaproteobacteria bacterium]